MWQTREVGHEGWCVGSGLTSGDRGGGGGGGEAGVGRCSALGPAADLPGRALSGRAGDHCIPKLPAGALAPERGSEPTIRGSRQVLRKQWVA